MKSRRIVSATIAVVACVAAALAVSAPALAAAAPTSGGVLSLSPAVPDESTAAGKSYFVHNVTPGTTWTSAVIVANNNATTMDAWVDPVAGLTSARTGAVYAARSASPTAAAGWVTPSVRSLDLAPHTQTTVPFTVTVPLGASAGDHLAGIAVEAKLRTNPGGKVAITTVLRSVIAVQVIVPGAAMFNLHVYGATVAAVSTTGTSGIAIDMADSGGLLGKPQLEMVLDGPAGYHRAQTVKLDTMLPGDRISDELLWPDSLAAGDYHLSITEDGGGRHGIAFVTTAHLLTTLVPSRLPSAPPQAVADVGHPPVVLLGAIAGGAVLLVLVLVLIARARRRRCLHCQFGSDQHSLVTLGLLDEIGGCMSCAVKVHNSGGGVLCRWCLRSHLRSYEDRARRSAA